MVDYTYGNGDWGDLLTAYDGETIEYDNVGNPISDGTWTYTWEHGRQLASMTDGTTTISYTYNAEGLRIGKTVTRSNYSETHEYYYNNGNLSCDIITIVDNGETIEHYLKISYDESGRPLVVTYDHKSYYYLLNAQGDVMGLTTVYGVLKVAYTYDAWGNVLSVTGPLADTLGYWNPCRYRGYVYDKETGLYYCNSRYYDPEIGRFINADVLVSTGQGILGNNMFAYCRNNPVCRKDISGTTDVEIFDDDSNLLDDDEVIHGGKMSNGGSGEGGGSSSNTSPAQTGSSNAQTSSGNARIPQYAYDTLDYVKNHNGSPPSGYKGGKSFANDGRDGSARLPDSYAPYREYDVHPKFVGQGRGTERIVVGNGVAFYTPNHYKTFLQM